ncbi:uncharacterized protein N7479_005952 [Penicillium vulpinum]|uniref:uncharacterized protein n=1 Tax=Penicillium vulpinum TaxID=29845 RepID=UPI00254667A0|nr:uncharacterized protein N7479_005952 [Penicillium vulpinum]KAJ5958802.1 hypothetical protein N7479_005952 [Penicillium vulpinum]
MGKFNLHSDKSEAWANHAETAAAREAEIRAPGSIPKENFWQPGEWGDWTALEKKLEDAYHHRKVELFKAMKSFIEEAYKPDTDEKEPSAEAVKAVATSVAKDIVVYLLVQSGMYDHEGASMAESLAKKQAVSASRIDISGPSLERIKEAYKEKKSIADILSFEMNNDIKTLDMYITVMEPLEEIAESKKQIISIFDPSKVHIYHGFSKDDKWDMDRAQRAIKAIKSKGYMIRNRDKFTAFFDTDEKAAIFGEMFQDVEWSNDLENIQMERSILEALLEAKGILALLLKFMVDKVDGDAIAKVDKVKGRLQTLNEAGRHALTMDLLKDL